MNDKLYELSLRCVNTRFTPTIHSLAANVDHKSLRDVGISAAIFGGFTLLTALDSFLIFYVLLP